MSTLSVIAVLALFIYIVVGLYALRIDSSQTMNRLFFLECLSLAVWALTAVIIYSSNIRDEVILWYKISSFGFGLYYALILHMYLLFTRTALSKLKIAAIYTPALIIITATWFSYTLFEDFIFVGGEWKFIPAFSHAGFYAYAVYYISYVLITIRLLTSWQKRSGSEKEKNQSRIISLSYICTVILCTTTDFILPGLQWYKLPALAPILLVINTGAIVYVLQKYRFLSPAEDIFSSDFFYQNKDMAILIDGSKMIITANRSFCDYFLCTKDDVAGRFLDELFAAEDSLNDDIFHVTHGKIESCSGVLRYSSSISTVFFRTECVRVTDKFGDYVGNLITIKDADNGTTGGSSPDFTIDPLKDFHLSELPGPDREWGIELNGRIMWYPPWPSDGAGIFRNPEKNEIDDTFSISGEAVKETLLYFENCGGDTGRLVSMLNTHMTDEKFSTSRQMLLDHSIWYSHEFYFYFIMFTKKITGRYDFHFGENSDEQLSIHHKVYEKGFIENIPYGKDKNGKDVQDVTTNNVLVLIMYLEQAESIRTDDLILFTNSVLPGNYQLDRNFYNNESIWCSLEFIEYGFEFIKIIGNGASFLVKASRYSTLNQIRIGKLIFLVPKRVTIEKLKLAISKVNNIHDHTLSVERGYAKIIIRNKPGFNLKKYSKYIKSSIRNDSAVYAGALSGVFMMIQDINKDPDLTVTFIEDTRSINFTIEYRWNAIRYGLFIRLSAGVIFSVFAGLSSFYFGSVFYTVVLTAAVSAAVYFYENKKRISKKLEDHLVVSNQQLDEYERISAELLEEHNTLEHKVEERTSELALANTRLNELDRLKSDFFANISHEIRTPLTLILTPIEALLYEETARIPERGFFESIHKNGLRLLGLINNLLDFSKLDAGHSELALREINITALIKNHVEAVRSMNDVKGIELLMENNSDDLSLTADPDKMDKIIANLFSNAIKFSSRGGQITVNVYKESVNDSEFCVISIADTGIGIPEQHLEDVFDRFSQVDSNSSRRYEGTGIGLALVREYVNLHGGTISVESRHIDQFPEDHGSVFTIKIPAGKKPHSICNNTEYTESGYRDRRAYPRQFIEIPDIKSTSESVYDAPDTEEKTFTILVVEDNQDMHNLLYDILSPCYRITKAYNGKEALILLDAEENLPDLILSDVMMPEMDGNELTHRIRNDPRFEGIPVILLTARSEMNMKMEGFDTGATDYIIKPFNSRELTARIKSQIELKELRDRLLRTNRQLYAKLASAGREPVPVSDSSEKKIHKVIEFINESYTADISREGLASAVDMNPDNLSRLFNRVTGKRIDAYINELRINRARQDLAETDKSVIAIAMNIGFENLRTFNRLFRESEGMTPKEFREMSREKTYN